MLESSLDAVRCIAFDFCGTLADLQPSSVEILSSYLQAHVGMPGEREKMVAALDRASTEMPYSSLVIRSESERRSYFIAFNARVLGQLGRNEDDGEDLYNYFRGYERHWTLKPEVPVLLQALRSRGYQVVLASNFDPGLSRMLARTGSANLFDRIYVSAELGIEKPDLAFYRHLQDSLGYCAGEIAMVGDDLSLDIKPALAFGMRPIHLLNGAPTLEDVPRDKARDYIEVSELNNLLQLLPGRTALSVPKLGAPTAEVKP